MSTIYRIGDSFKDQLNHAYNSSISKKNKLESMRSQCPDYISEIKFIEEFIGMPNVEIFVKKVKNESKYSYIYEFESIAEHTYEVILKQTLEKNFLNLFNYNRIKLKKLFRVYTFFMKDGTYTVDIKTTKNKHYRLNPENLQPSIEDFRQKLIHYVKLDEFDDIMKELKK